jgi:nucleoid DNA-binding protein
MSDVEPPITPDYNLVLWAMSFFRVHEKAGSEIAAYIQTQRALNVPLYKLNFEQWRRLNPWTRQTAAYRRFMRQNVSSRLGIPWIEILKNSADVSYDDAAECFQIFLEEVAKSLAARKNVDFLNSLKLNVQAREPARQTPITGNNFGGGNRRRKPWRVQVATYKGFQSAIE